MMLVVVVLVVTDMLKVLVLEVMLVVTDMLAVVVLVVILAVTFTVTTVVRVILDTLLAATLLDEGDVCDDECDIVIISRSYRNF